HFRMDTQVLLHDSAVIQYNRHSFPTRRSSDLKIKYKIKPNIGIKNNTIIQAQVELAFFLSKKMTVNAKIKLMTIPDPNKIAPIPDRKSTRLNSSHVSISYAVFCLKKIIYDTTN